jgi:3-methyladenine DNA glycosylase AlkD
VTTFVIDRVREALTAVAVPDDVPPMQAYMKGRFPFLGVKSPARRRATAEHLVEARRAPPEALLRFARDCWKQDEREFQYVGTDVLKAGHRSFDPSHLDALASLVTSKSWWDTVDVLAAWPIGSVTQRHCASAAVMDRWVDDADMWIARTAILHQLRRKETTDVDRLFGFAIRRGTDTEFFIRKAIGWSLREYAHVAPDTVASFVGANESAMSALTKREALKNITRQHR